MRNFMADSDRQLQHIPAYLTIPAALGFILILAWVLNHALEQQKNVLITAETQKSHLQTHNIAQAIETRIKAQRRITLTFALEHKNLLEHILSDPNDFSTIEYYRTLLKTYLPPLFAFSLYDPSTRSFILQDPEFEGKIDKLCAQDTQRYSSKHHLNLRIHPNPIQYHYDLYHSIQLHNNPYILFTSFRLEPLVQLLKQAQLPGHRLYLVRHTPQGELIELSAQGDRKALLTNHLRTQAHLTPEEIKHIRGRALIPCSEWEVVDLVEPGYIQTLITKLQAHLEPFIYLTLFISGLFLGFLWYYSHKEERFIKTIQTLNQELKAQAEVDGLTGLVNRRMFDDALQLFWAQAQRTQTPLSLVMIDLDYFKRLNDALGHLAGDHALKQVAQILKKNLKRKTDLAARYGGEELAILLPDTRPEHACKLSEKIRQEIESLQLPNPETPLGILTASFGVAGWVPDASTQSRQLVHCADKMLYLAKTNGRNRCECTMEDNCPADDMG